MKVPEPRLAKRRRSALSRVLLWTFVIFLLGGIAAGAAAFYAQGQYTAPGPLAEDKVFIVEQGLSTPEIGAALEQNGIIANSRLFAVMAYVQRMSLKAGEYAFAKGATMQEVMALIASGRSIAYKLTIPEGFTSEMAVARVNANEVLTGPPAAVPPEGSILPDTYVFRRGMTRQKLVEDMQAAQAKLLDELWAKRASVPAIASKEQAVTLASIVEKETAVAEERPVIASVFINRLDKGMRLQSDPTIIYGIAGGKGRLDRELTRADIETPTPYNTYRIDGLPPGPIANPGRAALEAVLNPKATDYLYFVADGTGGHAFATTLEEHNRNVRQWRQIAGNAAAAAAAESGAQAPAAEQPPAPEQAATPAPTPPAPTPAPVPPADAPSAAPAAAAPSAEAPLADAVPPPPAEAAPAAPAEASTAPESPAPAPPPSSPTPPKPSAKPATRPAAEPPAPSALKPGTIVMVEGRPAVIPRLRPAR